MSEPKDGINTYVCDGAFTHETVTVNRDEGTTPFSIMCPRPGCGGSAFSQFYRHRHGATPTHEWFSPTNDAELVATLDAEIQSRSKAVRRRFAEAREDIITATKEHVQMGGLLLRAIRSEAASR